MYSIAKFHSRTGRLGVPLSSPFPVFELENVRFRHGATSMIAGKPGAFKSVLALNMLVHWAREGMSAMYFSADSDEHTVARRLAGIVTGIDAGRVDADFTTANFGPYLAALGELGDVRFEYRAPDGEDAAEFIATRLNAYEAVYGSHPQIVFVDNAINFSASADDWAGIIDMTRDLDALARETSSHICILHHASESWGHPTDPVPRAAIQGKVTQIPRLVLTVAADQMAIKVACVKNTNGPQYPEANRWMNFTVENSLKVIDHYQESM